MGLYNWFGQTYILGRLSLVHISLFLPRPAYNPNYNPFGYGFPSRQTVLEEDCSHHNAVLLFDHIGCISERVVLLTEDAALEGFCSAPNMQH